MTQMAKASRTLAGMLLRLSPDEAMAVELGARHFFAGTVTILVGAIAAACHTDDKPRAFR
ncbi:MULTISPECIES: hypothetical protein [Sphingomonas]|jgi:D-lyxose ketol-isomerase|uniref:hypothetical protein n=1 Tax=Sphingomonas TaxID=13687 RepID=UPI001AE11E2E